MSIKIIIADDHELLRKGFRSMLEMDAELEVIGEASNGEELLSLVAQQAPDIVITDIQMPVMDGIEAARQLKKSFPDVGVIALTMFNDDKVIVDMLEASARGYLLKNASRTELTDAIRMVHRGGSYFCTSTSAALAGLIASNKTGLYTAPGKNAFTKKEVQIMRMICEELQNVQIAKKMSLGVRTVESYRERIFEKTGARNIAGVVIYAIRNGVYKL
jgi:DNA-binding NarL/FixJ family response regulator